MPAQKDHYLYIFTPDLELALHVKVTSNAASACICSAELCCARSDSCNATPPFIFASKNGIKVDGKQNYQCKDCKRQFIGDHALSDVVLGF